MSRSLAVRTWMRLLRVQQKIAGTGAKLTEAEGINAAQFSVLSRVAAAPGMTQQELADDLLVTKGNISQLIDKLEREGWLLRRHDGLAKRLFLTEAGEALVERVLPLHDRYIDAQFAALTPDELIQLHTLLRRLDHQLD